MATITAEPRARDAPATSEKARRDAWLTPETADPAVTMHEMIDIARDEAARIEATQEALVSAGMRRAPDPDQERRAAVFYAAANLLTRIDRNRARVRDALAGGVEVPTLG